MKTSIGKDLNVKKDHSYHYQQLQEDNCMETIQGYDQLHPGRKTGNVHTTHLMVDW